MAYGTALAVRHSVPLGDLDADEFADPLRLVTHMADQLEIKFGEGDRH